MGKRAIAAANSKAANDYLQGYITDELKTLDTLDDTTQDIYREVMDLNPEQERLFADLAEDNAREFANQEKILVDMNDELGGTLTSGFSDLTAGQGELATTVNNRMDQSDATIATGFTGLQDSMATGVDTITNNVDTRTGELQNSLTQNFDNTNTLLDTGMGNLSTQINTNDSALLDTTLTGFGAVGDNLASMEGNLSTQLTDTSTNVLGATDQIQALIAKYGGDAAQYYADLSAGQASLREGQGSLQGGLDNFRSDFGSYSDLANQTRSQLGASVVGGFNAVGSSLSDNAQATDQGLQGITDGINQSTNAVADVSSQVDAAQNATDTNFGDIAASLNSQVSSVEDQIAETSATSDANFSDIATGIATGQAQNTAEGQAMQADFVSKLTDVQAILQSDNSNLDEATRKNYQMLVESFDAQGSLIESSQLENGNVISRAIADQGGLVLSEVANTGTLLGQQTLDLDAMLSGLGASQTDAMNASLNTIAADQADGFSNLNTSLSTGLAGNALQNEQIQTNLISNMDQFRSIMESQGSLMGEDLSKGFTSLLNSFDSQGQLITNSLDATGNIITRGIDTTGNLLINTLDANTGQLLDSEKYNTELLSQDLTTKFTSAEEAINVVGASINQVGDGVQQGLSSTSDGFASLNTSLSNGLAGNALQNEQVQMNLTSNMDELRTIMETQGGLMGEDLAQGFTSLLNSFDSQGQLITNSLDATGNFITREIDAAGNLLVNTLDANTGELLDSEKYNTELLSQDLTTKFTSAEDAIREVGASINQVGDDMQQNLLSTASGLDEGFTSRFDEISDQQSAGQQEFLSRLQQAEAFIVADVAGVDQGLKNSISAVSDAFDETGKLVQNAIDKNGNYLNRAIDDQGSLILTTFSSVNGQRIDQQAIDINRILNEVSKLSLIQGSNVQMAGQSPTAGAVTPASPYSGLASPYAQTN